MKIVVVGATGNVGSAVMRRLAEETEVTELVGVARRVPAPGAGPAGAHYEEADVSSPAAEQRLTELYRGADAVVHLAWALQPNRDEEVMRRTNVDGLDRSLAAVRAAGVSQVVVASSVGAYSFGPKHRRVDERWPTGGLPSAHYARHKAANERQLDSFEESSPGTTVTRLRPGLVMNPETGAQLRRLFLNRWFPLRWLVKGGLPVLPFPSRVRSQVVYVDDLADLVWRALERRAGGAFNVAAEPPLGARELGELLAAPPVPVRTVVVRGLVWFAWRTHLIAMDPGWIDIAASVPIMSTKRAREELDWQPRVSALDAVSQVLLSVADDRRLEGSPPLDPARG